MMCCIYVLPRCWAPVNNRNRNRWVILALALSAACYAHAAKTPDAAAVPVQSSSAEVSVPVEAPSVELVPTPAASEPAPVSTPAPAPVPVLDPQTLQYLGAIGEEMDRTSQPSAEAPAAPGIVSNSPEEPSFVRRGLQAAAALAFVLGLIVLLSIGVRKLGRRTPLLAGASLAKVLGRVHLERGACLHFLQTGGRVLVIGVTPNTVSLVAEFDADTFEPAVSAREGSAPASPANANFLEQLLASTRAINEPATPAPAADDDEIVALRDDLDRLQQHLRDISREPRN